MFNYGRERGLRDDDDDDDLRAIIMSCQEACCNPHLILAVH